MRVIEIFIAKAEHVNVVETHPSVISVDEDVPTTQLQETQWSAYSSNLTSHQDGEFTNLLHMYSGMVGVSSSQEQNMMYNSIHPNQSQALGK